MVLLLQEDIAAVKKYYPNIPEDTFMELISLDPTYTGKDSVGKYGKWLLNLFNRGKISEKDSEKIPTLLNQFTTYKNRIQNRDLNSYKTLDELAEILSSVVDDMSTLTPSQKTKFLKRIKSGKVKIDKSDDYEIVLDTPNFIVYVPNTHEASMKLGKGTKWCTAHENPEHYNSYTEDNGKLYIIKNKKTGERWQYSDLNGEFLDEDDAHFNIAALMKKDAKLSKFFEKFLGIDFCNFDGSLIYNGKSIPEDFKNDIKHIKIIDGVDRIKNGAFYAFINLESVSMPDSITSIGYNAFENCASLSNINISKNVISIGESAFWGCESLTDIIIPNGVTEIDRNTFECCTSLESIIIPDSVTKISRSAFYDCDKLTVYTDNDYVVEYCEEYGIPVKPLKAKNESLKLRIREY